LACWYAVDTDAMDIAGVRSELELPPARVAMGLTSGTSENSDQD
jgi:hypothetical protein